MGLFDFLKSKTGRKPKTELQVGQIWGLLQENPFYAPNQVEILEIKQSEKGDTWVLYKPSGVDFFDSVRHDQKSDDFLTMYPVFYGYAKTAIRSEIRGGE